MKKLLLILFIFCSLPCFAQKQKTFFYDGIELHNVKGWTIVPTQDGNLTTITLIRLPFQMQIVKAEKTEDFNAKKYLESTVEKLVETNMVSSGKSPKIKSIGEITDGFVNNIPAKYVDITYNKKVVQRIYTFAMYQECFIIQCTGIGNIDTTHSKILSSFTYNPPSNTYNSLF